METPFNQIALLLGVIEKQSQEIACLNARVEMLEQQLHKNSQNSLKLPPTDSLKKTLHTTLLRTKGKKNSGAQVDHVGLTLKQIAHPDKIVVQALENGPPCLSLLPTFLFHSSWGVRKINNIDALNMVAPLFPAAMYWHDTKGSVLGINIQCLKVMGKSMEEVLGKTPYDFYPKEVADHIWKHSMQVFISGETLSQEEYAYDRCGNCIGTYLSIKAPLYDEDGEVLGILGTSIDITAEKEANKKAALEITERKKLEMDLKKLIQTMKLLGTSIAHELRTPLRSINSCAQAIKQPLSQELTDEPRSLSQLKAIVDLCKIIESETKAAFTIIDMLLVKANLSQVDTSTFKIFSVAQCVAEAVDRYVIEEEERKLIDLFILEEDFLCKGDYILLTHVLFNLLKNALYYIHAANKGRIEIKLQSSSTYNQLTFKDSGSGIAPEVLPYIFDNFFSQTTHGTGIGLAFCKLVLTSFGGDISCRSIYGEFTEFILTFPQV